MFKKLKESYNNFRKNRIIELYEKYGFLFGDAVDNLPVGGKCHGFDSNFRRWKKLEKKYALLGYRTVSLEIFVAYVHGKSINHLMRVLRDKSEPVYLYAEIFQTFWLDKINNGSIFGSLEKIKDDDKIIQLGYIFPATEDKELKEKWLQMKNE